MPPMTVPVIEPTVCPHPATENTPGIRRQNVPDNKSVKY
jgi:hypothetical protein